MTLTDLQTIPCFEGWMMVPKEGPRRPLTPRERQILECVLGGRTRKEVAFDLGIATPTVRVLYSRAMKKLGRARTPLRSAPLGRVPLASGPLQSGPLQSGPLQSAPLKSALG
jgi:hypothetical protein